jgi:hypothetical protein
MLLIVRHASRYSGMADALMLQPAGRRWQHSPLPLPVQQ